MKKLLTAIILTAVIVGAGAFYGGMKYAESKKSNNNGFPQMSDRIGRGGNRPAGANLANGEIIAKDNQSITIKLRDGGSKIIFFSAATQITKTDAGSSDDLQIGENISVNGTTNSDGSLTAQSIQLRPAVPPSAPAK